MKTLETLKMAGCGALAAFGILFAAPVGAVPVTILNPGFESSPAVLLGQVTDWSPTGGGSSVWNINAAPLGFWTVPAPQGSQIGVLSSAPHPGSPASFSQVLSASLTGNTIYNLSGYVGHPLGYDSDGAGNPTVYAAALYAGGNFLASLSGTGPAGTFTTFNLLFDSTGSAFVGQSLEIRLSSNQAQTGFDAIALDASAKAAVPDGGWSAALLLVGVTSLAALRRNSLGIAAG